MCLLNLELTEND